MAKITIRRLRRLTTAAKDSARRNGVLVRQTIARALAKKIGLSGAAEFFAEQRKGGNADWAVGFLEGRPQGVERGGKRIRVR